MNEDQVKGRFKETKGDVKKGIGKAVGNDDLEAEGRVDKATGKVQSEYGDVKSDVDDKVNK